MLHRGYIRRPLQSFNGANLCKLDSCIIMSTVNSLRASDDFSIGVNDVVRSIVNVSRISVDIFGFFSLFPVSQLRTL